MIKYDKCKDLNKIRGQLVKGEFALETVNKKITLPEHLKREGIESNIAKIIVLISNLAKPISDAFHGNQGKAGTKNVYGEEQLALDKWADRVIIDELKKSNLVRTIASEEQSEIIEIIKSEGLFGVVMDPLDGSSLIGVNLSVGTIVGIYNEGDAMEPGSKMDAALYLLYGPLTVLVYSAGNGVHEFTLKDDKFHLTQENIKIPEGKLYAPGGLRKDYLSYHKKYIAQLEEEGYKLRYSGAFVADVHQILHKGGIFTYPATKNSPEGKLRLVFEANPLSFIIRQAEGAASNGVQALHEIVPNKLEQRTPIYIGSKEPIKLIESMNKD